MNSVLSLIALIAMICACLGWGSLIFRLVRCRDDGLLPLERLTIIFALGFGVLGWILFFPGIAGFFSAPVFWSVLAVGCVALLINRRDFAALSTTERSAPVEYALLAVLAVALGLDLIEALAPPADADTLAYHFALPRDFLVAGQIEFVPRAISGAIPLLVHLTYATALATGGELTLTLWTMVTGWATGLLLYAGVRRFVSRPWALALLAAFMTTPAVLYGGGSGQIEIRCAMFALASVLLIAAARRADAIALLVLAALSAGFFVGTKYFGLIFAGSAGLIVLFGRNGLKNGILFGVVVLVAGFQWYVWNSVHTGDPVFPMLTNAFGLPDSEIWTQDFGVYFQKTLAVGELPLDRSLLNWLLYPFYSVFNVVSGLESGRTGLGLLLMLILPFAVFGLIKEPAKRKDATLFLAVAAIFYTVWFFSGTTQRTRHLLPIYPILLLGLFPGAVIAANALRSTLPVAAGITVILVIQMGGQSLFTFSAASFVFGHGDRARYLDANVPEAETAKWANEYLSEDTKVGFMNRQLAYLIDRPSLMLHPHIQVIIDARPVADDESKFMSQIETQGIGYLLLPGDWKKPETSPSRQTPFLDMIGRLIEKGCLNPIRGFETVGISSRTLRRFGGNTFKTNVWAFRTMPKTCLKKSYGRR